MKTPSRLLGARIYHFLRSTDLKELSGPLSGYEGKALVENKRCSFFPCGCWLVVVVGVPFLSS